MESHEQLVAAFLSGELDPAQARRWDEHLLECETCWRAVQEDRAGRQAAQVLRQPAPPGLADRVAFAVEVAAAGGTPAQRQSPLPARLRRRGRPGRRLPRRLAGAGMLAVGVAVTLLVVLLPRGRETGSMPPAVAAVARYAQAIPSPGGNQGSHPAGRAAPVEVGRPVTVTAGGQTIVLRIWRLGGTEAVVAVSDRPFPMPANVRGVPGMAMAWTARAGTVSLYCLNGTTSELLAGPVPGAELEALAARLPPA